MSAPNLPASLVDNPRLDRWIHFQPDRTVRIATGKVEIGQGVVTALGQIAADELDLPLDRVTVLSGDTDHGPDELYTTSSLSVEVSGGSVRLVCAEVRAKALERAALRLNCSRDELSVVDGQFLQNGEATGQDYWTVAPEIDLTQAVTGTTPAEARRRLQGRRPERAARRPAGEGERRGLRARLRAQGPPACPDAAPAQPRRHAGGARRGRDPPRGERRIADRARSELRRLRQSGRERGPGRRGRRPAACDVGQCAAHRPRASGGRLAEGPARRRPAHRRGAGDDRRPSAWCRSPSRGPTSRTPRWRRPARWPSSATAISRCGRMARACIRCARTWRRCSACRSRPSPRGTCTAPAATATTAPTMRRSTRR